jgi:hypothetical protein
VAAYARQLAPDHGEITLTKTDPLLLTQLQAHQRFLRQAYSAFVREAEQEMLNGSHVAEWLLDNFHIVQRNLRQIAEDMPATFYHELPKLTTGPFAGYPRVYAIAHTILAADGVHIDVESVQRFVQAYQEVTPLRMGELWALPVMLRLTMIEVLVHLVGQALDCPCRKRPLFLPLLPPTPTAQPSCRQLVFRACGRWIPRIGPTFFEAVNLVDHALTQDPAGVYCDMEFATRDQYRKVMEQVAQATGQPESEVAATAVALAQQAQSAASRTIHPRGKATSAITLLTPGACSWRRNSVTNRLP